MMQALATRLRRYRSRFPGGPLSLEWAVLSAVLCALALWLSAPGQLPRSNAWLHDLMAPLQRHRPAPDVVLVVADDSSMAAIGRWPWRRALHTQVLRHIDAGQPQAIGLDILFTEEDWDYPEDDLLLAQAIDSSTRVVLPLIYQPSSAETTGPLPLLAHGAARLGHSHLPLSADGAVRHFLPYQGPAAQPWLHWPLAVGCIERTLHAWCTPPADATTSPALRISFAQGVQPFATYRYWDVLTGRIPSSVFRNKLVLLGVTATGVANQHATPGAVHPRMASVDIAAHVLSGAVQGQHTQPASHAANAVFNVLPLLLALVGLALLGPSAALALCGALMVATLAATVAAHWGLQRSFEPAAALLLLASAYPLWSWRRLNAAARFLQHELRDLQSAGLQVHEPHVLPKGEFLQHRLEAVERASQQLRQLHQLVSGTLQQLPSPTLVCDAQGCVLLANSAAHSYAQSLQRSAAPGASVAALLHGATARGSDAPLWQWPMPATAAHAALQIEGTDVLQRSLLLIGRPFAFSQHQGWLVTLVDITELRQAVAQRDQAMHFISHDIRAPIGAIVTLLEMAHTQAAAGAASAANAATEQLHQRITHYAHNALELADDFVHLVRTQHASSQRAPVELGWVLDQALDEVWASAQQRRVQLQWLPPAHEAWVLGDASQLRRLCVNLLSNAIKYGPADSSVHCTLSAGTLPAPDGTHTACWVLAVRDEGAGISAEEQQRLFAPFARQRQHESSTIAGVGLGLAYVHTVAQQHGGDIRVHSAPSQGSTFALHLPQHVPPADTAESP